MSDPRTLIVVQSVHHQNTAKLARAMADVLNARVIAPEDASPSLVDQYDMLGVASGIYFGMFHRSVRRWIDALPQAIPPRPAFIASTAGLPFLARLWHAPIRHKLAAKRYQVIGEFTCRGFDTFGPLRIVGGLNRHHPDAQDLARAADFARGLLDAT